MDVFQPKIVWYIANTLNTRKMYMVCTYTRKIIRKAKRKAAEKNQRKGKYRKKQENK